MSTASKEGSAYDCKGREILAGDTLRLFHFIRARNRKRCFMYKYVQAVEARPEWKGAKCLRVAHLDVQGDTFLHVCDGKIWEGAEIVQGYGTDGTPFDERPRIKSATPPANEQERQT
jgi:hypothetical protein